MAMKIKKGDEVQIMAGKDKGQRGKVLLVNPKKGKVLVEGLNMVKRHQKPQQNREGGIIDKEAPLHICKVMIIDPNENRPCRVGFITKDGKKLRVSRKSGALLD